MFRIQTWATAAAVLSLVFGFLCAESFACDACDKAKKSGGDAPTCCSPSGDNILNPAHTKVKVKLGGYRLSVNYAGGEGGSIAREADEAEVIGPDINVGVGLARDLREARDAQASQDVCKLFKTPFTRVVTQVVHVPCPQPVVDNCAGLAFRRAPYCSGLAARPVIAGCNCNGLGCTYCRGASYVPSFSGCTYCRGVGCTHCRGTAYPVRTGYTALAGVYQDHPRGYWCNCLSHQRACVARYGVGADWRRIPCMCAEGCSQCGGAGHCGH